MYRVYPLIKLAADPTLLRALLNVFVRSVVDIGVYVGFVMVVPDLLFGGLPLCIH